MYYILSAIEHRERTAVLKLKRSLSLPRGSAPIHGFEEPHSLQAHPLVGAVLERQPTTCGNEVDERLGAIAFLLL